MTGRAPPWSGTYVFQGPSDPSSKGERINVSLVIDSDGHFSYTTHTYDMGSGTSLCCKRGVLALEGGCSDGTYEGVETSASWVLHVLNRSWRESSWNGEGEGSSRDLERLLLSFTGTDKVLLDGRVLEKDTERLRIRKAKL
eukprot:CAMPEP_0118931412 /NCGR_PEP_ID=MMETSP1169-20130426/7761_1 /TAXON_ID=36882 /ORGANISM="Pyramimonas obovata, Strain CCMP722" /LENGTH=140 /DNA_ID=CAMNT_0006873911 /DNA_START=24 /DNA_END=446 /DNA_ORIENTATION=-